MLTTIKVITSTLALLVGLLLILVFTTTYQPASQEDALHICGQAPKADLSKPLEVATLNAQFFAGTEYLFYFDMPGNQGPDLKPDADDIEKTLNQTAALIIRQTPDILLLQEIHDGAAATNQEDQIQQLLSRLPKNLYPCRSEAFYWKAMYIPHPKINGSVGMKLVTLSKYKISKAKRHNLPQPPMDWLTSQFYLKRAILETEIMTTSEDSLTVLNTHFEAFAQGSDTMAQQVAITDDLLKQLDQRNASWILGGDLNLLMPGEKKWLDTEQQYLYADQSEITPLLKWNIIPSQHMIKENRRRWATHQPNDPRVDKPDRTIDYLLHSHAFTSSDQLVLNQLPSDWMSDHFWLQSTFRLTDK